MRHFDLLSILANGKFYSGEVLGQYLGVSRSAVWKALKKLESYNIEIYSVNGKGYRLKKPLELLDKKIIQPLICAQSMSHIDSIDVLPTVDSTNNYLQQKISQHTWLPSKAKICLAEHQTAGRGRRGREWFSPYGKNIYFSLLWKLTEINQLAEGLNLVIPVAVCKALERSGLHDIAIKWPNDIYWQGKKLAGILVELCGESNSHRVIIIGIGVNYDMSGMSDVAIDQAWTDVKSITKDNVVSRNQLTGYLITEIMLALLHWRTHGFEWFLSQWQRYDCVTGQQVEMKTYDGVVCGRAIGIDLTGALLLETRQGIKRFYSGDVSLRIS